MVGFVSYRQEFSKLLPLIVAREERHVKWLNALSYLENCGARKIAACEHPTKVRSEMLKHAAEEFRHAFYLKTQIRKITHQPPSDYSPETIFGGIYTIHYLHSLDLTLSRDLKMNFPSPFLKGMAYLLVTYAIELRASELYLAYQQVLKETHSPVSVKGILLEEEQHLAEMKAELAMLPSQLYIERACAIESSLCKRWINLFPY